MQSFLLKILESSFVGKALEDRLLARVLRLHLWCFVERSTALNLLRSFFDWVQLARLLCFWDFAIGAAAPSLWSCSAPSLSRLKAVIFFNERDVPVMGTCDISRWIRSGFTLLTIETRVWAVSSGSWECGSFWHETARCRESQQLLWRTCFACWRCCRILENES